jgi:hypothetical protein
MPHSRAQETIQNDSCHIHKKLKTSNEMYAAGGNDGDQPPDSDLAQPVPNDSLPFIECLEKDQICEQKQAELLEAKQQI